MQHAWEFIAAIQFDGITIYYRRMRMRVRVQLDPLGHWITIASKQNTQTQTMELKRNKRINTLVNCECVYIVNCIHRSSYAGVVCVCIFFWCFFVCTVVLLSCTFNRWFRDNVIISMNAKKYASNWVQLNERMGDEYMHGSVSNEQDHKYTRIQ